MKVYIAGPVTGIPDGNLTTFNYAEQRLRTVGFEPINPRNNGAEGEKTWLDYMRASITQLMTADGVALLPGYETSRGAVIEKWLAGQLGLTVMTIDAWLDE